MLGWFFLRLSFDFQLVIYDEVFVYHSKNIVVLSLNLNIYFSCDHFSKVLGILRKPFSVIMRLRNRSKLVVVFSIIDFSLGTKSITSYFIRRMWGDVIPKKNQI